MSEGVKLDIYELSLYALLHDVGKPFIRLCKRALENIEEVDKVLERNILAITNAKSLNEIFLQGHDKVSREIIKFLLVKSPNEKMLEFIRDILRKADSLAAAERGYETDYKVLFEKIKEAKVLEEISKRTKINFNYHTSPLLSPLWLLFISKYRDGVGPKSLIGYSWDSERASKEIIKKLKDFVLALESVNVDKIVASEATLLNEIKDVNLWFPIKPLTPDYIRELDTLRYEDSCALSSYSSVVSQFIKLLTNLRSLLTDSYGSLGSVPRGLVDTVLYILKSTVLFVPSAIFGSIVPDISLFSHSKAVAAYASALAISDKLRLLVIDANNIQEFISAPIKSAAASRQLRGRSLLVDLALDSLGHYALEVFNELPEANILISEGGALDIVVPNVNVEDNVEKIVKVSENLSKELGGELGFTVAYSEPLSVDEAFFIPFLKGSSEGFPKISKNLMRSLNIAKVIRKSRSLGKLGLPRAYDSLTLEPLFGEYLEINEEIKKYADTIAGPNKLAIGDVIGKVTHLSLVLGTTARNLISIISLHLSRKTENTVEPYSEMVSALMKEIGKKLGKNLGEEYRDFKLLYKGKASGIPFRISVGIIPLLSTGTVYLTISLDKPEPYDPSEPVDIKNVMLITGFILEGTVLKALETVLKQFSDAKIKLRVKIINSPAKFLPDPVEDRSSYEFFKNTLKKLVKIGVYDVGFGFKFMNTYHPVKVDKEGNISLISLDEYGIISLVKIDLDGFGEVRTLMSFSPSRLITLSDIVNTIISGKAYLTVIKYAKDLSENELRNFDVIPLYAEGDDITLYGNWAATLHMTFKLYRGLYKVLYPITASAGVIIDHCSVPILDIYGRVIERLEEAKKIKDAIALPLNEPRELSLNSRNVVVNVVPPGTNDTWPSDPASKWCLKLIGELLDPLKSDRVLAKLNEVKRELYLLSTIGFMAQKYIVSRKELPDKVNLELAYAYTWARREENLNKLLKLLKETETKPEIPKYPQDIVDKGFDMALKVLAAAKPVIDLILLALRKPETLRPTMVFEKS